MAQQNVAKCGILRQSGTFQRFLGAGNRFHKAVQVGNDEKATKRLFSETVFSIFGRIGAASIFSRSAHPSLKNGKVWWKMAFQFLRKNSHKF